MRHIAIKQPAPTSIPQASDYSIVERAYLAIDAIDSTRLCTATGDLAGYRWLRSHLDRLCRTVHDHGGEIVKTLGDGLEACFADADDALVCGLRILNFPFRDDRVGYSAVRIGLVYGRLIRYTIDGHVDYFGRDVILASRLSRYGTEPGLFMTTHLLAHLSGVAPGLTSADVQASEIRLKGIDQPVLVHQLLAQPSNQGTSRPHLDTSLPCGQCSPDAMRYTEHSEIAGHG
ncbi:MAG: adenylate/guanylate cyclase domain-containing protein [Gammaproteobacteria bacterium]